MPYDDFFELTRNFRRKALKSSNRCPCMCHVCNDGAVDCPCDFCGHFPNIRQIPRPEDEY